MKTYKLCDDITDEMLAGIALVTTESQALARKGTYVKAEQPVTFGGLLCDLKSTYTYIPMSYAEEIIESADQKTSERTLEVISKELADVMNKVHELEDELEEYVKEQGRKNGIDISIEITGYNS